MKISKIEYLIVFLLVALSGNPVILLLSDYRYIIFCLLILIFGFNRIKKSLCGEKAKLLKVYLITIALIFIGQTYFFKWNTFPGIVNFYAKLLSAVFVYLILDYRFKHAYIRIMCFISIVCLFFWFFQVVANISIGWDMPDGRRTIFFYSRHFRDTGELLSRNSGFFWEPGAFACYLNLVFILFVNEIEVLFEKYKVESIIIVLALASSQSTTGYTTFGIMILVFLLHNMKSWAKYLLIPLFVFAFYGIYTNAYFLSEKLTEQTESSMAADGEYNSHRLGSFLFDLKYIKKHPLFGNGLHSRTQFADDPLIWQAVEDGDLAYSGNGFSGLLKSMGFIFFFLFCYVFFKNNKYVSTLDKSLFMLFLSLLLFGEPLGNYPIVLGLPFLKLKNDTNLVNKLPASIN